jgi:6-phosphofructokinase 1
MVRRCGHGTKGGSSGPGIGKAAGASLTVIPEEFVKKHVTLDEVCDVLEGAILKRLVMGRRDGVAVVAEGIAEKLEPAELARLPGVEVTHDQYGHIRLGDIPLAMALKREVKRRFDKRGDEIAITDMTLDTNCALRHRSHLTSITLVPWPRCRSVLASSPMKRIATGRAVWQEHGRLQVLPFADLLDPVQGTRVRIVDVHSEHYTVARDYMIRLERRDLEDAELLARLASSAEQ